MPKKISSSSSNVVAYDRLEGGDDVDSISAPFQLRLLERLEKNYGHREAVSLQNLQIEHVLPQTLEENPAGRSWKEALGVMWEQEHARWVHTLGNLTLTGYNQVMSNDSFTAKQAVFAQSNVSLNSCFVRQARWNSNAREQRAATLGRVIADFWPRPDGVPFVSRPSETDELFDETVDPPPSPPPPHVHGRLKIIVHWSQLGRAQSDEPIRESTDAATHALFISRLITQLGPKISEQIRTFPIARTAAANPATGYRLSTNPTQDFLNPSRGRTFGYKQVPETPYFLFTNTDHDRNVSDILLLARRLGFPPGSIEAF